MECWLSFEGFLLLKNIIKFFGLLSYRLRYNYIRMLECNANNLSLVFERGGEKIGNNRKK